MTDFGGTWPALACTVARPMPPTKPPTTPLEAEIADTMVRIENNYVREGTGYGSRFEGERLEVVQARWAIARVRAHDDARLIDDEEYGAWYAANVERLDEIDEDMTHAAVVRYYLRSAVCAHCRVAVVETPTPRDPRHDHCGPLPHVERDNDCPTCGQLARAGECGDDEKGGTVGE